MCVGAVAKLIFSNYAIIETMKNEIEIPVEWGDTDPATIVFYPNYFKWFDIGTRHLLDAAGLPYKTLIAEFGLLGLPLVEANGKFLSPIRFGDTVRLVSFVSSWQRMTVQIGHRAEVNGKCCGEGLETRVLAKQPTPGTIKAVPPPERILQALPVYSQTE